MALHASVNGIKLLSRAINGKMIRRHIRKICNAFHTRARNHGDGVYGNGIGTANGNRGNIVNIIEYTPTAKKWNNKKCC
jgi:hypothetical protein